jgi:hypothetical protein
VISLEPSITGRKAFDNGLDNMRFRRAIIGVRKELWINLKKLCVNVSFSNEQDGLYWLLTDSGQFSTKSFYLALQNYGSVPQKFLWKIKIPLQIKTFIWLVFKKNILTKDVLMHRGGKCDPQCLFCGKNETIDHLLFACRWLGICGILSVVLLV